MLVNGNQRADVIDALEEIKDQESTSTDWLEQSQCRAYRLGFLDALQVLGHDLHGLDDDPEYRTPTSSLPQGFTGSGAAKSGGGSGDRYGPNMTQGQAQSLFFNMPSHQGASDELASRVLTGGEGPPGAMERFVMWLMGR